MGVKKENHTTYKSNVHNDGYEYRYEEPMTLVPDKCSDEVTLRKMTMFQPYWSNME